MSLGACTDYGRGKLHAIFVGLMNQRWGNACAALEEVAAPTPDEIAHLHRMGRQNAAEPGIGSACAPTAGRQGGRLEHIGRVSLESVLGCAAAMQTIGLTWL